MKKLYIAFLSCVLLGLLTSGIASAATTNSWGLTGVKYTSRADRGADETRRYQSRTEYKKLIQAAQESADDEPTKSDLDRQTATDYVLSYFAKEFGFLRTVKKEGTNTLFWPLQYARTKTKILVHHTATNGKLPKTIEEEKAFMKEIYKFHAFGRGRGDIGYNFIIMPSGRIYEGRKGGAGVVAAHATRNNTPSIGVSLVGNFENIQPEQSQISALETLLTSLTKKYNINPTKSSYYFKTSTKYPYVVAEKHSSIAGHEDAGLTACPGENLYALLGDIRSVVSDRLAYENDSTTIENAGMINVTGTKKLEDVRSDYFVENPFVPSKASIKRLGGAPIVANIAKIQDSLIRVLLYDASTTLDTRNISCSPTCSVRIGNTLRIVGSLVVNETKGGFTLKLGNQTYTSTKFAVQAGASGTVAITNYNRIASNKIPLNVFRQTLLFMTAPLQTLDGKVATTQQVINIVSLQNYMRGIAEASDTESQTKTNVLALLSKGYALYYMGGSIVHPNVPKGAFYNAIDDPRLFQKYLGYGRESISKNRPIALTTTQNKYLAYKGVLPILPYFHCSAGFTLSSKEKRGRLDTPYLQSVLDTGGKCDSGEFEGHGVGLSGKGAAKMALEGKTEQEIIQSYYPGVEVVSK